MPRPIKQPPLYEDLTYKLIGIAMEIHKKAEVQLGYYLKGSNYRVGLLLNFGSPKLQIKRRIYG